MSIFEEVGLGWDGEEFIVPPDRVMGLIEVIEDVITLDELGNTSGVRRVKLAKAYAAALRYAGAKVKQEEVYDQLFASEAMTVTLNLIQALQRLMIPPEHLRRVDPQPDEDEKPKGKSPAKKKSPRASSSKRT